jgi:hypothetical protein
MPALKHLFTDSRGFSWLSEDDFVSQIPAVTSVRLPSHVTRGLLAGPDAELREDRGDVALDRAPRDHQPFRDARVRPSFDNSASTSRRGGRSAPPGGATA